MNNFFSMRRFAQLMRAHYAEHQRTYFWFMLIAVILDLIYLSISFVAQSRVARPLYYDFLLSQQVTRFTLALFATSFVFAGRHFKALQQPGPALTLLMRPGSAFEKCLLALLVVGVAYPVVFTCVYSLVNWPFVRLADALHTRTALCDGCPPQTLNFSLYVPFVTSLDGMSGSVGRGSGVLGQWVMLGMLWTLQGVVLGGTVFFRRAGLSLTILTGFVVAVVLSAFGVTPHLEALFGQLRYGDLRSTSLETTLAVIVWGGLLGLSWVALYFHIREREVA